MNQIGPKLEIASSSLLEAKSSIDTLYAKIKIYEGRLGKLDSERDSLLHTLKKETTANWVSVQSVLKKQTKNNEELSLLKQRNEKFK